MNIKKMVLEDIDNLRFYKVRLYFVKDGETENDSVIPFNAIKDAESTIFNIPLLAKVRNGDFMEHEQELDIDINGNENIRYIEQPIGFIPKDCNYRYEEIDGEQWASCIGIIWKGYCNIPVEIIKNKKINNMDNKISIEIKILNAHKLENGKLSIDKYFYRGITMLGSHISEGIKGAKLNPLETFNKTEDVLNNMISEYNFSKKIDCFSKDDLQNMLDSIEFGNIAQREELESEILQDLNFKKPKKYKDINFVPPELVAKAAQRGLDMRNKQPSSNKCCTPVGLARARQLVNRQQLSPSTIRRMKSYFDRHKVDKQSQSWKEGNSKGEQAWLIWGGDEGYTWVKDVIKKMENADKKDFNEEATRMNKEVMKKIAYSLMNKNMSLFAVEEGCVYAMGLDEKMMKIPYAEKDGDIEMSYDKMASEEVEDISMAMKIMNMAMMEKIDKMYKKETEYVEKYSKLEKETNNLKIEVANKIKDIENIKEENNKKVENIENELFSYKEKEFKDNVEDLIEKNKHLLLEEDVENFNKKIENKEIKDIDSLKSLISSTVYENAINAKGNFSKIIIKQEEQQDDVNFSKMPLGKDGKKDKEQDDLWA